MPIWYFFTQNLISSEGGLDKFPSETYQKLRWLRHIKRVVCMLVKACEEKSCIQWNHVSSKDKRLTWWNLIQGEDYWKYLKFLFGIYSF